jgi:UDP-N-acetylglucosamine diphosphorylase/glucosamine-1-phosphate N-acetyltransferase
MIAAIVFDDGKGSLGPLTDLRASFAVRTGALTTLERISLRLHDGTATAVKGVWTPAELEVLTREQIGLPVNEHSLLESREPLLLVNGRCPAPSDEALEVKPGAGLVTPGGDVVAACLSGRDAESFLRSGALPPSTKRSEVRKASLVEQPWDVIRFRDEAIEVDLEAFLSRESQGLPPGVVGIDEANIVVSPDALVYPGVVLDAENGPIVIDDGAVVRPGSVVIGPAYIGRGSTVIDRALIKGNTAIGPVCKVAGEVGGTIFQGLANKAHDGHLGDSWIGEWTNLGAGTTNSNLLNTYGEVVAQAEPNAQRVKTGLQFLGCIAGDHVKTAILTRLMTGAVIGTGSMLAAMNPPACVGRFEWITEDRRQPFRFEKFLEVAKAAMARRKTGPSKAYTERLRRIAAGSS